MLVVALVVAVVMVVHTECTALITLFGFVSVLFVLLLLLLLLPLSVSILILCFGMFVSSFAFCPYLDKYTILFFMRLFVCLCACVCVCAVQCVFLGLCTETMFWLRLNVNYIPHLFCAKYKQLHNNVLHAAFKYPLAQATATQTKQVNNHLWNITQLVSSDNTQTHN